MQAGRGGTPRERHSRTGGRGYGRGSDRMRESESESASCGRIRKDETTSISSRLRSRKNQEKKYVRNNVRTSTELEKNGNTNNNEAENNIQHIDKDKVRKQQKQPESNSHGSGTQGNQPKSRHINIRDKKEIVGTRNREKDATWIVPSKTAKITDDAYMDDGEIVITNNANKYDILADKVNVDERRCNENKYNSKSSIKYGNGNGGKDNNNSGNNNKTAGMRL